MTEVNELGRPVPELGKVDSVDVRTIWPNEARDFTPWLAGHLDLLGDALGMALELVQREAAVGKFSLDILAQKITGEKVVIENQLAWTDHSHLCQILTYAAGHDARTVVWVTPGFQDEHRAAIDWLNRWTPEEIAFYGVEVSAIRIGESLPAPVFRPVAFPNDWSKTAAASSPEKQKKLQLYVPVIEELLKQGFADKHEGRYFPSGFAYTSYAVHLAEDRLRVFIWINAGSGHFTNRIFDALHEDKESIEAEIKAEWFWKKCGNNAYAWLGMATDGSSLDDLPERAKELQSWVIEHLPKLKAVLNPRLEKIIGKVQAERAAAEGEAPETSPDP